MYCIMISNPPFARFYICNDCDYVDILVDSFGIKASSDLYVKFTLIITSNTYKIQCSPSTKKENSLDHRWTNSTSNPPILEELFVKGLGTYHIWIPLANYISITQIDKSTINIHNNHPDTFINIDCKRNSKIIASNVVIKKIMVNLNNKSSIKGFIVTDQINIIAKNESVVMIESLKSNNEKHNIEPDSTSAVTITKKASL